MVPTRYVLPTLCSNWAEGLNGRRWRVWRPYYVYNLCAEMFMNTMRINALS